MIFFAGVDEFVFCSLVVDREIAFLVFVAARLVTLESLMYLCTRANEVASLASNSHFELRARFTTEGAKLNELFSDGVNTFPPSLLFADLPSSQKVRVGTVMCGLVLTRTCSGFFAGLIVVLFGYRGIEGTSRDRGFV